MSRTKITVNSTVVLRKGEDLSDRYEPCSSRPLTGFQPAGIRGTVLEVDTEQTDRPIQVRFEATGVTAWFSRRNLRRVKVDERR